MDKRELINRSCNPVKQGQKDGAEESVKSVQFLKSDTWRTEFM